MSLGAVNYCLKALIRKGLVKARNFSKSSKKMGYVYQLTPAGIAEKTALTGRFFQRKLAEYEALRAEIADLSADLSTEARSAQAPRRVDADEDRKTSSIGAEPLDSDLIESQA